MITLLSLEDFFEIFLLFLFFISHHNRCKPRQETQRAYTAPQLRIKINRQQDQHTIYTVYTYIHEDTHLHIPTIHTLYIYYVNIRIWRPTPTHTYYTHTYAYMYIYTYTDIYIHTYKHRYITMY